MERKDSITQHRSFDLCIKAKPDASGHFSGYGSVWGVVDSYREIVAPGAFAASIADTKGKGRTLPILWQHRSDEPIGQWDVMREDDHGLFLEGELWTDEAPNARVAHRGMKAGAITGLSIGFYTREDSFDEKTRIRTLKRVDLVEVSVVTNPANDEARVDTIKAKLAAGERISDREFKALLSDRGFARSDADTIADVGFNAWAARGPGSSSAGEVSDLLKALSTPLTLPTF
ncbi:MULTISPECIES: HK97 family phage prohead protease [unclassified Aureimonas]|uniref:HK97 family phage prohead protease n=1 Tax=unclassified Aureimonas TaxID=2615206 RepID=UPI0006F2BB1F|nr:MULTISPECIES: HK97 family phage prohead protease [unclassified Aureimonas]KQT57480.1 peptidase U35 [Aureimonas sp. Leaf427]KQT77160.1 peptidase U35 [Aureimonas sp. Leaf460]